MSESSYPWNGTTVGDATLAPYDGPTTFAKYILEMARMGALTNLGGVLVSELNQLNPTLASPNVVIDTGRASVYGDFYESTGTTSFNIPTPASATRIDLIVLRKSWGAQTTRLTRVAGAEGGAAPSLTQIIGTTWDVPIAQASITTGGVITLTDTRAFVTPVTYSSMGAPTLYDAHGTYTYTTPNGATALRFFCIGAGGAGSGVTVGGVNATTSGGGGGAGAAVESFVTSPAATYTIVVGQGGTGGTGAGTDGTDSTVNTTLVVAKAGKGCLASRGSYGAGGAASGCTGDIKIDGGPGMEFPEFAAGTTFLASGLGGSAKGPYGGPGGASVDGQAGPAQTGKAGAAGGGGSGGSASTATVSATGGAGGDGRVVVFAYH